MSFAHARDGGIRLTRRGLLGAGSGFLLASRATRALAAPSLPLATAKAAKLIAAATQQIGVTTLYDPSYQSLKFPGGDVKADRGVCTDVVIRAYRVAFGYDLQERLNADIKSHGAAYPSAWGRHAPDPNIDHRRVLNLRVYFARLGAERPRPPDAAGWEPGDLVTQTVDGNLPHIGIVSSTPNTEGSRLMVIHNIGAGAQMEDTLMQFPATGRYRWLGAST